MIVIIFRMIRHREEGRSRHSGRQPVGDYYLYHRDDYLRYNTSFERRAAPSDELNWGRRSAGKTHAELATSHNRNSI
jgi:hypothetical protein